MPMKPIKPDHCSICGRSLKNAVVTVGTGNGRMEPCASIAHGRCYAQAERLFALCEALYDYEES